MKLKPSTGKNQRAMPKKNLWNKPKLTAVYNDYTHTHTHTHTQRNKQCSAKDTIP